MMGRRPSAVATLVERSTRAVRLVKLPGIKGPDVRDALIRNLQNLPPWLLRSLTWDRGREMSEHERIAHELGIHVYFCDPRPPWQRGSNENIDRLLRQYLPKQADLSQDTQVDLDRIAEKLNTRPRYVLGWDTSQDRLRDVLIASHPRLGRRSTSQRRELAAAESDDVGIAMRFCLRDHLGLPLLLRHHASKFPAPMHRTLLEAPGPESDGFEGDEREPYGLLVT